MKHVLGRFDIFDWRRAAVGVIATSDVVLLHPYRTEQYLDSFEEDTLSEWPYRPRGDDWPLADTLWYAQEVKEPEAIPETAWQQLDLGAGAKSSKQIDYWSEHLFKERLKYTVLQEPDLLNILPGKNVLVIPGAILLAEDEKRAIKDFLAGGGRVLACWSIGSRNERGEWVGLDFLSQLTGGLPSVTLRDTAGSTTMVFNRNSPITSMIPSGTHLDILSYNGYFAIDVLEPRTVSDAVWFQPYWRDDGNAGDNRNSTVVHGTYLDGKFVWLNFMPETVQETQNNTQIVDRLLANCLAWLRDEPLVDALVWPDGYHAGGAMLVKSQGSSALLARAIYSAWNYGITYDILLESEFIPMDLNPVDLTRGDIILYSSEAPTLKQIDFRDKIRWFEAQAERMKDRVGKHPVGFAASDWSYTSDMLWAASRAGFKFILGDRQHLFYGPRYEMVKSGSWWNYWRKSPIILYPKSALSMREWYILKGRKGEALAQAMMRDMKRITNANGLYVAIYDAELLTDDRISQLPAEMAAYMDSSGVWRTSVKNLMERFAGWTGVRVNTKKITSNRVRVNISNGGKFHLKNVMFQLYYLNKFDRAEASSEVVGVSPVDVTWDKGSGVCRFKLNDLKPRDNLSVFIDFTKD